MLCCRVSLHSPHLPAIRMFKVQPCSLLPCPGVHRLSFPNFGTALQTAYACDPFSRQFLRLPKPTSVDFRASCFCHKRSIDIGFICSVCLSIFCEKVPACITCGEDFEAAAAGKPS